MKDGQCPKCGEREVRVYIRANDYRSSMNIGGLRFAKLDTYVCGICGYTESYIHSQEDLNRIAEQWPRVEGDPADQATRRLPPLAPD